MINSQWEPAIVYSTKATLTHKRTAMEMYGSSLPFRSFILRFELARAIEPIAELKSNEKKCDDLDFSSFLFRLLFSICFVEWIPPATADRVYDNEVVKKKVWKYMHDQTHTPNTNTYANRGNTNIETGYTCSTLLNAGAFGFFGAAAAAATCGWLLSISAM